MSFAQAATLTPTLGLNMVISSKLAKLGRLLSLLSTLNFIAFFIGALLMGGDALSGYAAAGHYFVANHGQLTEVSHALFVYSKLHAYSVILSLPIVLLFTWLARNHKIQVRATNTP